MSSKTKRTNAELARQIPEAVASEKDLDRLDDLVTADFVDHSPLGEMHGVEEMKESMRGLFAAFSDLSATVEETVAEGDVVAMRVTLRGTHEGPFMGVEATGRSFEIPNMVFSRIEGDRIAERWVLPDMAGLFRQLGVATLPTP